MTHQQFIQKVQNMRLLQAKYFAYRKANEHTKATSLLPECMRAEKAVDAAIPEMLSRVEIDNMPKLF